MWHVPSVVNDPWSQIYAPLNGCSDWGRYHGNCKFLLTWLRDRFSWSSHDLHPNIIPANFFWVKSVRWPRFPETFRRLPKISDEFPKTSERCRKLNVRRLFPKTFEHFWSYLKDDTFSVLWYDFVRTQKRTQSHHVLRTICLDLWVRRHKLSLMRQIDVFRPQAWLDSRIMRIQYCDGINFDWPKGWQCWNLASKNVRVEESNTRLEKRRATWNAYKFKFIYPHLFNYNTTTMRKKRKK